MAVPAIDYTSRHFEAIRSSLISYLQTNYPNSFRDMTESGIGMALIELLSYVGEMLSFQLDYVANENFITTARDRNNVMSLGKLVGYQMRTATSASVNVTASISGIQLQRVVIPAGTVVVTAKGVTFQVIEEQYIPIGDTSAEIVFVQGESQQDTFSFPVGVANWKKFVLSVAGVIYGSVEVYVDGDKWTRVDSLVYASSTSKSYTIDYDDEDRATIQFGDGTNGQVPAAGASIEVTYRTGGGIQGNINVGEINTTVTGYLEGVLPQTDVDVALYNFERGSGGEERETVEHAKLWIPYWVKTNGRAVTLEDFNTLATAFSDPVYGAFAYTSAKLSQEIPESNLVEIYGWARGSGGEIVAPSDNLKNALSAYFNNNGKGAVRLVCVDVEVLDGENIYTDVEVSIKVQSDFSSAQVISDVTDALTAFFSSSDVLPGQPVRVSKIYSTVMDVEGVEYCLIDGITASRLVNETIAVGDGVDNTFSGTLDLEPGMRIVPGTCVIYSQNTGEYIHDDGKGNFIPPEGGSGTIDYSTGAYSMTLTSTPLLDELVIFQFREVIDYQRGELLTTASGSTARFKGKVKYAPVVPLTGGMKGIAFTDGDQVVSDDGSGNLIGDVNPAGVNRIDYSTGAYDFTFTNIPVASSEIRTTYRQELSTPNGDLLMDASQLPVKGNITVTAL